MPSMAYALCVSVVFALIVLWLTVHLTRIQKNIDSINILFFKAVLDVLNFYENKDKDTTAKFMTVSKPYGK